MAKDRSGITWREGAVKRHVTRKAARDEARRVLRSKIHAAMNGKTDQIWWQSPCSLDEHVNTLLGCNGAEVSNTKRPTLSRDMIRAGVAVYSVGHHNYLCRVKTKSPV